MTTLLWDGGDSPWTSLSPPFPPYKVAGGFGIANSPHGYSFYPHNLPTQFTLICLQEVITHFTNTYKYFAYYM